jgi:acetyl esterase/lipase
MASREYEEMHAAMRSGFADPNDSVAQVREKFAAIPHTPVAPDVKVEWEELGGIRTAWVTPAASDPTRILLHAHGGAFVSGSAEDYLSLAECVARPCASRVAVFDYRLAPEHRFPAALDDFVALYRALLDRGESPERIGFSGDSCGGGLAIAALVSLRDAGLSLPACAVGICAWLDLEVSGDSACNPRGIDPYLETHWIRQRSRDYLGSDADARHPLASPIYADPTGLPPLFLQCGEVDLTSDDSVRMAERATAAGVDVTLDRWPEMMHGFQLLGDGFPEGVEARTRFGDFVRARIP